MFHSCSVHLSLRDADLSNQPTLRHQTFDLNVPRFLLMCLFSDSDGPLLSFMENCQIINIIPSSM